MPKYNLYVCSDGNFLHKNLTPYKHAHNHSAITLRQGGVNQKFNRGLIVYKKFVDPSCEVVHMRSMNYGDCRLDNLFDATDDSEA